MAAPRPPPNTPPIIAPVAPPTIAPPSGSCADASCIGIARAMTRQAEDPKARINPALLFSDAISPQDAAKTEAGTWEAAVDYTERPARWQRMRSPLRLLPNHRRRTTPNHGHARTLWARQHFLLGANSTSIGRRLFLLTVRMPNEGRDQLRRPRGKITYRGGTIITRTLNSIMRRTEERGRYVLDAA